MPAAWAEDAVPVPGRGVAAQSGVGASVILADVPAATAEEIESARTRKVSHVQGTLDASEQSIRGPELPAVPDDPADAAPVPHLAPSGAGTVGGILVDFPGLANSGWIPPDTVVAVGPRDVVEAVNSGFAVYSKHGTIRQGYTFFETFFAPVLPGGWNSVNGFMFDPRAEYHAGNGRFVMLILGADLVAQQSYVFVAITQTGDPTAGWWIYRFDNVLGTDAWLDYAGLGVDNQGLYFTGNLFFYAGGFKGSVVAHFGNGIYTGAGSTGCYKNGLTWPAGGSAFSLQAAHPHTIAGGGETFFVNTFPASGNQILLWRLTGSRTDCTSSLTRAAIATASYAAIGQNVDQAGSATDIDGGDARVMDAVYANRRVYATLASDQALMGTSSEFLVEKLNVDTNTNVWEVVYNSPGVFYMYPAITLAGTLDTSPVVVGISFTQPSVPAFQFASAATKFFTANGSSTAGPFVSPATGAAAYVSLDANNRNRWGDYSGADWDWSCGDVWTALEHAGSSNTWATRIDRWEMNASATIIFAENFEGGHYFCWSGHVG